MPREDLRRGVVAGPRRQGDRLPCPRERRRGVAGERRGVGPGEVVLDAGSGGEVGERRVVLEGGQDAGDGDADDVRNELGVEEDGDLS